MKDAIQIRPDIFKPIILNPLYVHRFELKPAMGSTHLRSINVVAAVYVSLISKTLKAMRGQKLT